ncbi:MAG: nucleotide exchange factor GrpE [Acidobacteriota bacterium]
MVDESTNNVSRQEDESQGIPIEVKVKRSDPEPIRVTDRRFWAQPDAQEPSVEEPPSSLKPRYVEELEQKLAESQKRAEEMAASFRAFKAESLSEVSRARERIQNEYNRRLAQAKAEVARNFIPILENLERAINASETAQSFESLLEGVRLIRSQFTAAFAGIGLEEIAVLGEPFNPELAEAIEVVGVEDESEDNKVLEVVARGYRLNDTVVRPPQVKVGKIKAAVSE